MEVILHHRDALAPRSDGAPAFPLLSYQVHADHRNHLGRADHASQNRCLHMLRHPLIGYLGRHRRRFRILSQLHCRMRSSPVLLTPLR